MNPGRIFANALARRFAYVIVAAALAWIGLGEARAQSAQACSSYAEMCTRPVAYQACRTHVDQSTGNGRHVIANCVYYEVSSTHGYYQGGTCVTAAPGQCQPATSNLKNFMHATACPSGQVWNSQTNDCQLPCTGRPSTVQTFLPLSGSKQCFGGCVVTYMQNGDDTTSTRSYSGAMCGNNQFKANCGAGFVWNGYMGLCQPVTPDCPTGQIREGSQCKPENQCGGGMVSVTAGTPGAIQQGALYCKPADDTCPQGTIKAPSGQCLPGEGQCAAGEARRKDGTCGKDDNGDGTADDEDQDDTNDSDKESFSGGDSCTAPPSCAGGPIDCGMARIQWRIDCNTRTKVNITGGACKTVPQCVGENCRAMEYAQLLQQWRTACALEKMADAGAGDGAVGDANKNGVADVLEGNFTPSTGGTGDTETGVSVKSVGTSLLNTDNIFGGGSCPQPPTFQIMGVSVSGADFPHWCNAMVILRGCILIFGAFTAVKILMGWGF